MSANRSGFLGAPTLLVFPSRASPARASKAVSVLSAGLKSTRTCTSSSSPAFRAACAEPAGAVITSPAPWTCSIPSTRRPSLPERTSKRSSWRGWTWSGPVVQPGSPIQSTWSNSPLVSRAVFRNTVRNPVTGFVSSSPALAMSRPPLLFLFRCSYNRPPPGFASAGITRSQLCPEPLDMKHDGERGGRGEGSGGPHVIPGGPLRDVLVPAARRVGALGMQRREPVVERDVARDRYSDGADEVERAAGEYQRCGPLAHGDHGPRDQPEASHGRPEQRCHEGGCDGQFVDRLHRRDAMRRRQPLQRGHHERREGEEDAGDQPASESGRQRRGVEDPAHRPPSQTP